MLNIYSNAIKFTGRDGKIEISLEKIVNINEEGGHVLIVSVTDSGVGIQENDKDKLFKLFGSIKDEKLKINT